MTAGKTKGLCERCGSRRSLKRIVLQAGARWKAFDICRQCHGQVKAEIKAEA